MAVFRSIEYKPCTQYIYTHTHTTYGIMGYNGIPLAFPLRGLLVWPQTDVWPVFWVSTRIPGLTSRPLFWQCIDLSVFPTSHQWSCFPLDSWARVLYYHYIMVQSGAPLNEIAKLVNITPITMVYGTKLTIVTGGYKPTNITGGPHIVYLYM